MNRFIRDNSKKIMVVMSVFLMLVFLNTSFSFRNNGTGSDRGERVVATMFGGDIKITALQRETARNEWGEISRLLFTPPNAQEPLRFVEIFDRATIAQIDTNPTLFLMLIQEARERGISVSNDYFQEELRTIVNMPTEYDSAYDLARQAVYDAVMVHALLDRVGDAVKVSHPRSALFVAVSQQEVSLDIAMIPLAPGPTTQPSAQQVQAQYDRYSQSLPGEFTAANPLGFGYRLPNRVKLQYLGFTKDELLDTAKEAHAAIEWDTKARRLYRTHMSDFIPTTQPSAPIAWEDLAPEVVARVYDAVYNTAATELAKKIQDRLTEQWSADWQAYHDANANGPAAGPSSYGTDAYLQKLASSLEQEFGVRPVLGIVNNGWKNADDLKSLLGIGSATTPSSMPFPMYATVAGQQFTESAKVPESQRLNLWQPSLAVYSDPASPAGGFFIFSLTAMDPSHPAPLPDARAQVVQDISTQAAWDTASATAAKLLTTARASGLLAATMHISPPPTTIMTDFFRPDRAAEEQKIPDLAAKPESAVALARAAMDLLTGAGDQGPHKVAQVALGPDQKVAVIELHDVHPMWLSNTDFLERQARLGAEDQNQSALLLEDNWAVYANAVDRTKYKEEPKGGE